MAHPEQVYRMYIKSTAESVWNAITQPAFTRAYWGGFCNVSDWRPGATWRHLGADGETVMVSGDVTESRPPHRLVLSWAMPSQPSDVSRVTFDIEPVGDMVCLTVTHDRFGEDSTMADKVAWGWPRVLSSLKSYLETGSGIDIWAGASA